MRELLHCLEDNGEGCARNLEYVSDIIRHGEETEPECMDAVFLSEVIVCLIRRERFVGKPHGKARTMFEVELLDRWVILSWSGDLEKIIGLLL